MSSLECGEPRVAAATPAQVVARIMSQTYAEGPRSTQKGAILSIWV